ncbi:TatD family hydrolase [Enterovirga sp.]|uniref:TatD family hydrolase n=1 Tax=Enterovirga sp. TaxID=2026350 RepID=UPI002BA74BE5|nr:TatD family hydrolase [Enterovirga sp.]HMO29485.1 TatD family hydrolase [Enterovirga sp.]
MTKASGFGAVSCPCCGGAMTRDMLDALLRQAREQGYELPSERAWHSPSPIIDPHAHMISRTTQDYEAMAAAGVVAVIEPAFWLGQPRTNAGSYLDYLSTILGFERFRASQFGLRHYCTVGLNPKEANNEALAEAVMELLPDFMLKEGVVALGELGYDEQTPLEDRYLRAQIELAKEGDLPILIHTPHRDKKRGTLRTMEVLAEHGFPARACVVDHNNEETVESVLERGYWAAFSIYPQTKMGKARMVEIVRRYGADRIIVNSACDWGVSDPLAVPKTAALMRERGIPEEAIRKAVYGNALAVYGLNGEMREEHWRDGAVIDQRELHAGNSVLRGGQAPRIERAQSVFDDAGRA